ncbi:MAG: hypothetical protein EBW14_08155 [Oxalobacteraceae bacterium]|nr:hypothetical protein [Oxalobacteraceae bacterium]
MRNRFCNTSRVNITLQTSDPESQSYQAAANQNYYAKLLLLFWPFVIVVRKHLVLKGVFE